MGQVVVGTGLSNTFLGRSSGQGSRSVERILPPSRNDKNCPKKAENIIPKDRECSVVYFNFDIILRCSLKIHSSKILA